MTPLILKLVLYTIAILGLNYVLQREKSRIVNGAWNNVYIPIIIFLNGLIAFREIFLIKEFYGWNNSYQLAGFFILTLGNIIIGSLVFRSTHGRK